MNRLPPRSRVLGALIALALASPVGADSPSAVQEPFLWMIEGDTPSFLLGTIHLPDDRVLALPEVVEAAFTSADAFYSEVPLDQENLLEAAEAAMLPEDQDLESLVPADLYARCEKLLEEKGLPIQAFARMKVVFFSIQIALLEYLQEFLTKTPLDVALYQRAGELSIEQRALETVQEQLAAIDSFDLPDQIVMLRWTLDSIDAAKLRGTDPVNELMDAYLAGDDDRLADLIYEHIDPDTKTGERALEELIGKRNHRMADRIHDRLAAEPERRHFFAVGAAHYPNDDGLVALLEKKGYRIRRLVQADAEEIAELVSEKKAAVPVH